MIGEAYSIIEQKVDQMDQMLEERYSERISDFFQKKYEKVYKCLETLKHDQEKQYVECLKKYEKSDLNIQHALQNEKNQLYTCVNEQYQISQKPAQYQPKDFNFNHQITNCTNIFEKNVIQTIEKQLNTVKIE